MFSCRITLVEEVGFSCLVASPYFKQAQESCRDRVPAWDNVLLKRWDWGERGHRQYEITRKQQEQHWSVLVIVTKQRIKIQLLCSWEGLSSALRTAVHWCSGSWSVSRLVGKCTDCQMGGYSFLCREAVPYRRNFYEKLDQAMAQFFQMAENDDAGQKG